MSGPYADAALLGLIQGLTEFLPISSDGHLALAQLLFGTKGAGLTMSVMLHVGTWLATVILLRQKAFTAAGHGVRALFRPSLFRESSAARDAGVVILASLPTAAIGLRSEPRWRWVWGFSPWGCYVASSFAGISRCSRFGSCLWPSRPWRWPEPGLGREVKSGTCAKELLTSTRLRNVQRLCRYSRGR